MFLRCQLSQGFLPVAGLATSSAITSQVDTLPLVCLAHQMAPPSSASFASLKNAEYLIKIPPPLETAKVEAFFVPFFKNPAYPTSLNQSTYLHLQSPTCRAANSSAVGRMGLAKCIHRQRLKEVGCLFHSILRYDSMTS